MVAPERAVVPWHIEARKFIVCRNVCIQPCEIVLLVCVRQEVDLIEVTTIDRKVLQKIAIENVNEKWPSVCIEIISSSTLCDHMYDKNSQNTNPMILKPVGFFQGPVSCIANANEDDVGVVTPKAAMA